MKYTAMTLALFLCFFSALPTAEGVVINVSEFKLSGKGEGGFRGAGLARIVAEDLASHPEITVITPDARRKIIHELELSQTGILKDEIKVAELLGADFVISGSYSFAKGEFIISAGIYEVRKQMIFETFRIKGPDDRFEEEQERVAANLVRLLELRKVLSIAEFRGAASRGKTDSGRALLYFNTGLHHKYSDPALALSFFQKAVNADVKFIDAIVELAVMHGEFFSRNDNALKYCEDAEKELRRRNETHSLSYAKILKIRSGVYYRLADADPGKLPLSMQAATAGLDLLSNIGLAGGLEYSEILNQRALAEKRMNRLDKSLKSHEEALKIKKKLGLEKSVYYAVSLHNLANLHYAMNGIGEASSSCGKSMKIKKDLGLANSKTYAVSLNTLGALYIRKNSPGEALSQFEKAGSIYRRNGLQLTSDYAGNRINAGYANRLLGNSRKSLGLYEEAQKIRKRLGLENGIEYARTAVDMSRVYADDLNDPCRARDLMGLAMSIKSKMAMVSDDDREYHAIVSAKCADRR